MWTSYLAIGDSTTSGVGDAVGDLECRSWADWVADALRSVEPALEYRNVGRRGATAASVIQIQVPELDAIAPDFVSVTVGGNDARKREWTAEAFEEEYEQILDAITSRGAEVMTATYPDIRPALGKEGQQVPDSWLLYFQRMHAVNEIIRAVGDRQGAHLVDLESRRMAQDSTLVSRDLTHPNALGYRATAQEALNVLAARLALPELATAIPVTD